MTVMGEHTATDFGDSGAWSGAWVHTAPRGCAFQAVLWQIDLARCVTRQHTIWRGVRRGK